MPSRFLTVRFRRRRDRRRPRADSRTPTNQVAPRQVPLQVPPPLFARAVESEPGPAPCGRAQSKRHIPRANTHVRAATTRSDRTRDAWNDRPTSSRAIVAPRAVGFPSRRWGFFGPWDRGIASHSLMRVSPMKPPAEAASVRRPFMYTRLRVKCDERTRERPGVSPHRHPRSHALARRGSTALSVPARFDGTRTRTQTQTPRLRAVQPGTQSHSRSGLPNRFDGFIPVRLFGSGPKNP
jgi:hypothetical protein